MSQPSLNQDDAAAQAELDRLFHSYRDACPDVSGSANFMPQLWSKIEAREQSCSLFGRMAKTLVTVALAASVVLGLLMSSVSQSGSSFNGTYMEALMADHASGLDSLSLDGPSELEQQ